MFNKACFRVLMMSSMFVAATVVVGGSYAQANTSDAQPLGIKKRISGWTSSSAQPVTTANANGPTVPCVLSTQYEEGTSLRFSGGGEKLIGISIVKSFDIFKPEYRYPVTITYAGQVTQRFQATSIDPRTLIIPLPDSDKAYAKLVAASHHFAPYVTIGIADFEQNYALDSIATGVSNLEACFYRKPVDVEPNVEDVIEAKAESVSEPEEQTIYLSEEDIAELEAYSALDETVVTMVKPPKRAEIVSDSVVEVSVAEEDDELEPLRLDVDLSEPPRDLVEVTPDEKEVKVSGFFEGVSEPVDTPAIKSVVARVDPVQPSINKPLTPMPKKVDLGYLHSIWVASKGETVEMVLRRWSSKADLDFEWNRKGAVFISDDKIYRGAYEDVTQKLLSDNDLLSAVEGDMESVMDRDIAFAVVEEKVVPDDTVSRQESIEDAKDDNKVKSDVESVSRKSRGNFFTRLMDGFSSGEKKDKTVEPALEPKIVRQTPDPWQGRTFPQQARSPEMAAVPAAAVQAVVIEPAAVEPVIPVSVKRQATAIPVSTLPPSPTVAEDLDAQPRVAVEFLPQRWRALKGASLKEVLVVWAEDAGVKLNWKAHRQYAVQDSISLKVPFDQAIVYTLDQFDARSMRPMGHLYVSPDSREAILTVYDSQ